MTTYYIFRHGIAKLDSSQSYGDKARTQGLLPEAEPGVKALADYLGQFEAEAGFRSPVLRCQQTAAKVSETTGLEFAVDERITEDYQEEFPEVEARVRDFFEELQDAQLSSVMICTHGIVVAGLKHLLLDGAFLSHQTSDFPPQAGLIIIRDGKLVEEKHFTELL